MENNEVQQQLFSYLKDNLPPHLSMVDELCDLLDLSADSVYRRIRGEKPITLVELKKICENYHLSLDQMLHMTSETVLFDAPRMKGDSEEFVDYMKAMLMHFKYFNSFKEKEMLYLCKDSTIWNFYFFPELAAFKTFFWSKTINSQASLSQKKFSLEEFPFNDCFELGQKILEEYNQIPSVELWNFESMHSTLNQVAYYRDAGNFKTEKDFEAVLLAFQKMIDHLQLQAEKGVKFMPGASEVSYKATIKFYINELILGNNTMVINLDGKSLSMITYSVFHYLFTKNPWFSAKVTSSFDTLLSRSTLISKTGEKDRNRFFNAVREKVSSLRN